MDKNWPWGFLVKSFKRNGGSVKNSICPTEIELNCRTLNLSNSKLNDLLQIFEKLYYFPLRNKYIDVDIEIPRIKVMDLVFVNIEIKEISKSTIKLFDFPSVEISDWDCAFDETYNF